MKVFAFTLLLIQLVLLISFVSAGMEYSKEMLDFAKTKICVPEVMRCIDDKYPSLSACQSNVCSKNPNQQLLSDCFTKMAEYDLDELRTQCKIRFM
eukprot:TRINITY_DN15218_c0_g1_i1.p1 TRINITY_DN15218_c0_g1~~TRINITY_DN15218_c0_g1_i1.p1  ORF type:complete len:110 (+),score=9.31 TRINITY_DN15218_c0_g1_i1:45-332(+)